jgi:uncharacterized SAM-binding protein YcdF (DUF218 family)
MVKQNVARWFDCFIVRPLALIGLLVVLVTATPLVGWYADLLAGGSPAPDGDVLIVLGASYMEKNVIGNDTYWRSVYALRAIRGGHFKHVVLVGYRVAEAMSQFLVFQGVPSGEISLEAQSTSTRENAI